MKNTAEFVHVRVYHDIPISQTMKFLTVYINKRNFSK